MGTLPEDQIRQIARDMLSALNYMHKEKRILHRDIKLENIMVKQNANGSITAKLIDFGLSQRIDLPQKSKRVGSLNYMAPEIIGQ